MATRTTFHLSITRWQLLLARLRAWLAQRDLVLLFAPIIISVVLGVALGTALYRSLRPAAPATQAAQPTAGMIIAIQTTRPLPTPTALPTAAPRMVTAYDSPNGNALGPIPEPGVGAIVARWGDAWLQTTWDNAPVWIMAADLGMGLADVRPVPQIQIVPVAEMAEQPAYHVANEPSGQLAPAPSDWTPDQIEAGHRQFGLTDADMDRALADHQAQQLGSCDRGLITNATYCAAVKQWMEEHR